MKGSYYILLMFLAVQITFYSCSNDDPAGPVMENENVTSENESDLDVAPEFSLMTYDDQVIKLSDYANKNLVIFFFGNNCPPCKAVGPDIEEKINQMNINNDDFAIIGIDQWDGNANSVEKFQETTGITFPLALEGSPVAREFGTTYDRLVVVNKSGKIAYKGTSIAANNLDEVITLLDSLLN